MKYVILLDVMVENLEEFLKDKGWEVETVSKKLGVTQENRDDTKIFQYAEKEKLVVITEDKKFIKRLKGKEMDVITVEDSEKAHIIHKKLEKIQVKKAEKRGSFEKNLFLIDTPESENVEEVSEDWQQKDIKLYEVREEKGLLHETNDLLFAKLFAEKANKSSTTEDVKVYENGKVVFDPLKRTVSLDFE